MQYNTQRDKLIMPEYGRTVQDMVGHALSIENRDERQRCAETIIGIMANMNPSMREQPDFAHRLWDHLAYISHYELDVDYPFPVNRMDEESNTPQPLQYPNKRIRNRHYGYIMERMLEHLATMPEGEERDELLRYLADQMKQSLYDWNRDSMDAEKIASDIARYTDGRVLLNLDEFVFDAVIQGGNQGTGSKKKKKKK